MATDDARGSPPYCDAVPTIRIAAAQLNLVVGDIDGNSARILEAYESAANQSCDLVVFPELAITGYPPEDLLHRDAFIDEANEALRKIAAATGKCVAVVGFPEPHEVEIDPKLFNSVALCSMGQVASIYRKRNLPNYSVFDEERYFEPGSADGPLLNVGGVAIAILICEDIWSADGPLAGQVAAGAQVAIVVNASPYYAGRQTEREAEVAKRVSEVGIPIVYANLVGGQDELVFDGASFALDRNGNLIARAHQFREELLFVELELSDANQQPPGTQRIEPLFDPVREIYEALVLGTHDYITKNNFTDVVIGLSGGVDSALVASIAVDAVGADHVHGVRMPSRYSSDHSMADAEDLASNLGLSLLTIPLEPAHAAFESILMENSGAGFAGTEPGTAEENIQARLRGNIIMSLSNKHGWLALSTGNKSEMAMGYATLYGDMAGGFSVIKDVPKTLVYKLCADRNARATEKGLPWIPQSTIDKPPSAELRPNQRDDDTLPPYEVLDPILEGYITQDQSVADLQSAGHDPATVRRVATMIDRNEYKRRQAAPGVRVSPKAFGKDRRLPITNRWPG